MMKGVRTKVNMLGVKMDKHFSVKALKEEDSESMQEAKKASPGRGRGTR